MAQLSHPHRSNGLEVREMRNSAHKSSKFLVQPILGFMLTVFGVLVVTVAAAASDISYVSANKLALKAYCSEARSESALLANGSTSYKDVITRASARAMVEYPNVCPDISAWKARIGAILDRYGDEALPQLCSEDPGEVGSSK
jgi:hypothetical protein